MCVDVGGDAGRRESAAVLQHDARGFSFSHFDFADGGFGEDFDAALRGGLANGAGERPHSAFDITPNTRERRRPSPSRGATARRPCRARRWVGTFR